MLVNTTYHGSSNVKYTHKKILNPINKISCYTLPNNELLMDIYKTEVANKDKGTHIAFYYSVSEMVDECNDDEDEAVQDEE